MQPPFRVPFTQKRFGPRFMGKFQTKPELVEAVKEINIGLAALKSRSLESTAKDRMLRRNLDKVMNFSSYINDFMGGPAKTRVAARKEVRNLVADILNDRPEFAKMPLNQRTATMNQRAAEIMTSDTARNQFFSQLTPVEADRARASVMAIGYKTPDTKGGRMSSELVSSARTIGRSMSDNIKLALRHESETIGRDTLSISDVYAKISSQERAIETLGNVFGGTSDPSSMGKAVGALRKIESQGMRPLLEAIEGLDQAFPGMKIRETVDKAYRGQFFTGAQGVPDINPRLSAVGDVMGAGAITRVTGVPGMIGNLMAMMGMTQSGVTRTIGAGQLANKMLVRPVDEMLRAAQVSDRYKSPAARLLQGTAASTLNQSLARNLGGGMWRSRGNVPQGLQEVWVDKDGNMTADSTKGVKVRYLTPDEAALLDPQKFAGQP